MMAPWPWWRTQRARAAGRTAVTVGALIVVLAMSASHAHAQDAAQEADAAARGAATQPLIDANGFVRAGPGRPVVLPRDHGSHPETQTEWWYLTGPLRDADGALFGFQATWFRRALVAEQPEGRSPLATRDVLLFHGVLIDAASGERFVTEHAGRAARPWGHATEGRLDVALYEHVLRDEQGDGRAAHLAFGAGDARLELRLDLSASPVLLHGEDPGLSVKGREPGEASWYVTLPRIAVTGDVIVPGREPFAVTGHAWMDHEFGSGQLGERQVGWDWFSVALDDGTDLMLYQLRLDDGRPDTTSSGTIRRDGAARHLPREAFRIESLESWTSPETDITYPSRWTLSVPADDLRLTVEPIVPDQELRMEGATGVIYWEGLCRFAGTRRGASVEGHGYVELVGYGETIRDRFTSAPRDG